MNPLTLALVTLRGLALSLSLAGQARASNALYSLADAAESGVNVDAHMAAVAEKLKSRSASTDDWSDVAGRIEADSDRLQGS